MKTCETKKYCKTCKVCSASVNGFKHKFTYLLQTVSNVELLCKLIEKTTRLRFIPAITGRYICSMNEGKLLVLTIKFGGFGPFNNCET